MNDESHERDHPEQAAPPEGPGRRLRERREALRLSRDEVAARLRLNARLVAALEEDAIEDLPPLAFVAGYLRSYGRLLDLPAEELVEAYNRQLPGESPSLVSSIKHREQVRSSDLPVRIATWAIVIGLAGLLGAWWLSQRAPAPTEAEIEAEARIASVGNESVDEAPPADTAPKATEPPAPAVPETVANLAPPPAVPPADNGQGGVDDDPAPDAAAEPEPTPEPPSEPAPPQLTPDMAQARMDMEFAEDCWTEVEDAAGRRLVYDLVRAGRSLRLRGEAPFEVFLGYAPGVEIEYNGRHFGHERYQRGNVARFEIGSPDDNAPLVPTETADVDAG